MRSERRMKILRSIEKLLISIVIIFAVWRAISLFFDPSLAITPFWWAVLGFTFILLVALFIIQGQVDDLISQVIEVANYNTNEKFMSLYERSPTAYITVDPQGKIVSFNPAAVHLLQSRIDNLGGQNFFDMIVAHTGHDVGVLRGKVKAGMTLMDQEMLIKTPNDLEIWALVSVHVDEFNNQRIISLVDTTQAKKVDTAKSEFVALATHQLRTPIAAIRWNTELLERSLRGAASEKQTKYLGKIDRNVIRMIELINDFLSASKLEMGTYAAEEVSINLTEFFDTTLDSFNEAITQKNISVQRTEEPKNFIFNSDKRLFNIIIHNLVSNAVKYMRPDGILKIGYYVQGNNLQFQVTDNGIGIPEGEVEKLFAKFFRASNAQSHQTEGTGLGLYVVKQSVEQLGGTIAVQSQQDVETTFTVTLPIM